MKDWNSKIAVYTGNFTGSEALAKLKTILIALALSILFFILKIIGEVLMLFGVIGALIYWAFSPERVTYTSGIDFIMFGIIINLMSLILYAVLGCRLRAYFHEDSLLELCVQVIIVMTLLLSFFSFPNSYVAGKSIEFLAIWYTVPVMSLYVAYRLSAKKKREIAQ